MSENTMKEICGYCNGTGKDMLDERGECCWCDGNGQVEVEVYYFPEDFKIWEASQCQKD